MEEKLFFPQVGDQVTINPDYWRQSGNGSHLVNPYCSNGPDHIYTITEIREDTGDFFDNEPDRDLLVVLHLDGENHGWSNRLRYLLPVSAEPDFEVADDMSALFE